MRYTKVILTLLLFCVSLIQAQDRIKEIEATLKEKEAIIPGLKDSVNLSVQDWELHTFIRSIGKEHQINIAADPNLRQKVNYDFTNVPVSDVFVFLCTEYNLEIKFRRSILSFVKYEVPVEVKPTVKRELDVKYDKSDSTFSASFNNDSLIDVLNKITDLSGVNFQINSKHHYSQVKANINHLDITKTLMIILGKDFEIKQDSDDFIVISKVEKVKTTQANSRNSRNSSRNNSRDSRNNSSDELNFDIVDDTLINLSAEKTSIAQIIESVAKELDLDFFVLSEPNGEVTLNVNEIAFESLLNTVFIGTDYTYKKTNDGFLIGEKDMEKLRQSVIYKFQQRSASEEILEVIPSALKDAVDVIRVPELNGLVLTGPANQTKEMIDFLKTIDMVIPLVTIEVMIVTYNRTQARRMGLSAGWDGSKTTGFNLNGNNNDGATATLSAKSINNLLGAFEGFTTLNLGQVSNNFYVQLDAMESAGVIKKESTPKLSTLNGKEASMAIESTEWYVVETQNVNPGVNPIQTQVRNYENVKATFGVTLTPLVSGQEYITMDIEVQDSDFGAQINPSAPPSQNSKMFKSSIRVKNGEMILLGGLTESSVSKSDGGVPVLSRIPVIKWFFSNSSKSKVKDELNIFIKTNVVY